MKFKILRSQLRATIIALALVASWSHAADAVAPAGQRVFVCAHSFMLFTAKLLPPMAEAAGIAHINAGQQMIGGSRVIQHWNLPDERNQAKTALREGKVDVLTLSPHNLLPDPGIDHFTQLGLKKNPALRVLVQASWPTHDGTSDKAFANGTRNAATVASLAAQRDAHDSAWLVKLEAQIRNLNQSIGHEAVFLVPVSTAVFALRARIAEGRVPGLTRQTDLFSDDLGHPRPPLALLVTYCHFAAIYGRSPIGLPLPAPLKDFPEAEALNRLLQQLAWEAVTAHPLSSARSTPRIQ